MKLHQTFRLDKEIIEQAKSQAKKENRSISNFYETAVKEKLLLKGLRKEWAKSGSELSFDEWLRV